MAGLRRDPAAGAFGSCTPTPGLTRFTAPKPTNSATVVTTSKYRIALPPMRPMVLTLPVPAMPTTSVANSSGAMIDLIMRRKMVPSSAHFLRGSGKDRAERDARDQRDQNPCGERRALHRACPISIFRAAHRRTSCRAAESG